MKHAMMALLILGLVSMPGYIGCSNNISSVQYANHDLDLLVRHHNEKRQSGWFYNVPKFKKDYGLMRAAQAHANEMARKGDLSHQGANGSEVGDRIRRYSKNEWMAWGENIALGHNSECEVIEDWMNSDSHKKNIMNKKFTHIGVGVSYDSKGHAYWCAVFAG